jgi:hypothetical protein
MPLISPNRPLGDRGLVVTPLAQSGLHFLMGVHNPIYELFPEWAYAATFHGVIPLPVRALDEMYGQGQVTWGPVCSPSFADSVKSAFENWIEEMLLDEDDDDVDFLELFEESTSEAGSVVLWRK